MITRGAWLIVFAGDNEENAGARQKRAASQERGGEAEQETARHKRGRKAKETRAAVPTPSVR